MYLSMYMSIYIYRVVNFARIFIHGSLMSRFFYNREKREIKDAPKLRLSTIKAYGVDIFRCLF